MGTLMPMLERKLLCQWFEIVLYTRKYVALSIIPITEVDSVNEDTLNTPASSLSGEERVLVEKDGKFELIKACEIEASPLDSIITVAEPAEPVRGNKLIISQPNHTKTSSQQSKPNEASKAITKSNKKNNNNTDSSGRVAPSNSIILRATDTVLGLSTANSSSSLPQTKWRSRPNTQPHTPVVSPSRTQIRPQTAPLDYKARFSPYRTQESEKRELAQKAFRAWLDMKDRQLIEVSRNKTDRVRDTSTRDTEKRKSDAYQAWMENKKKQVLSEIGAKDKKQTNNSKDIQKFGNKTTFDKWLKKKSKQNTSTVTLTSFQKQK